MTNLSDKIDELVEQIGESNIIDIVANPADFEKLSQKGLEIRQTIQTPEEYLKELFEQKKDLAGELIVTLPGLADNLHNSTIKSLYREIKECYVLGIPGASITLGVILLELALKYRLYSERKMTDDNSTWELIEQLDLKKTVNSLFKIHVLSKDERDLLIRFNSRVRNSYIHYNIQKLVDGVIFEELPLINIETEEVMTYKNVNASGHQALWYSAKKALDMQNAAHFIGFCISWANKLLADDNKNQKEQQKT